MLTLQLPADNRPPFTYTVGMMSLCKSKKIRDANNASCFLTLLLMISGATGCVPHISSFVKIRLPDPQDPLEIVTHKFTVSVKLNSICYAPTTYQELQTHIAWNCLDPYLYSNRSHTKKAPPNLLSFLLPK
jgi:hypothetical protein